MPTTLKQKLDAACEGRPVYQLTAEEQAWLEAERAAVEAGERESTSLEEIEARLEADREKPEARRRDRQVPPHR